ncbi:Imm8 family immunity protein [Planctomyces sp. SH-PL62]|uniref:Imm8 family immunity protein n=1 Tax=Planctomyces sp. SH-PL62 TaxID=1636152 RepID=UPI0018D2CA02|nr:Imm8 family immunity protein [Planctomyces sp. SH-PL62]
MRAELKGIQPNDFLDWDAFVSADRTQPQDGHGCFTLDIGPEAEPGSEMFQANVSTPSMASHARARGERTFRGFIVESFEPESIDRVLRNYVSSVTGPNWEAIVQQLRHRLDWEYEGMSAV